MPHDDKHVRQNEVRLHLCLWFLGPVEIHPAVEKPLQQYDWDHLGSISYTEFQQALSQMGYNLSP